jgi:hypothetical protein
MEQGQFLTILSYHQSLAFDKYQSRNILKISLRR